MRKKKQDEHSIPAFAKTFYRNDVHDYTFKYTFQLLCPFTVCYKRRFSCTEKVSRGEICEKTKTRPCEIQEALP